MGSDGFIMKSKDLLMLKMFGKFVSNQSTNEVSIQAGKTKVINFEYFKGHNSGIHDEILAISIRQQDIMAMQVECNTDLNQVQNVVSIVLTRNCEQMTDGRIIITKAT